MHHPKAPEYAPLAAERIANFNFERLNQIKWVPGYEFQKLNLIQEIIAEEIIGL